MGVAVLTLLLCVLLLTTPLSSPQVMGGRADMAALQVVVGDVFPPYSPPLVTQGRGGGAELPPGLQLTEDTTSHKEGWLGTEKKLIMNFFFFPFLCNDLYDASYFFSSKAYFFTHNRTTHIVSVIF